MLSQRTYIEDKIKGLSRLIPTLKLMKDEASELVTTINDISDSSEKISSKIRQLDSARVCTSSNLHLISPELNNFIIGSRR